MSSPDAVFRSLQAVVLIFFLLMDNFRHIHTSCENVRHSAAWSVQPFPVPSSGFCQSMRITCRSSRSTRWLPVNRM
ncbi:hypothetical protein P692DRAFT_20841804, partial [Suillus brevipes Sb2]